MQSDQKSGKPTGPGMTGRFEDIVDNELIVMSDNFADENGQPISAKEAGMEGAWHAMIYITFDFESLGANKSSVTLSQQGIPTDQQRDCKQGWNEMFDKLESYVSGHKQ